MRNLGKAMLCASVAVLLMGLVAAQQPPFGGFGGGRTADPAALIQRPDVKKELKLTDEQLAKVPDAIMKALGEVLDKDQLKRLKQIELQNKGSAVFKDAQVQAALKITGEQKENINTILDESAAQQKELGGNLKGGGGFQGLTEKMAALRKETNEKIQKVLTAEQRRTWRDMTGDEFKMETGFGGFGGFGGKKKTKKDEL